MSGFLTNLVARSLGPVAAIRPRSPSRFESGTGELNELSPEPAGIETAEEFIPPLSSPSIANRSPTPRRISPAQDISSEPFSSPSERPAGKRQRRLDDTESPDKQISESNPKTGASQTHPEDRDAHSTESNPPRAQGIIQASRTLLHSVSEHIERPADPILAEFTEREKNLSIEIISRTAKPAAPTRVAESDVKPAQAPRRAEPAIEPRDSVPPYRTRLRDHPPPIESTKGKFAIEPAVKPYHTPKPLGRTAKRPVETAAPEIHVNIGRIEVRAIAPPVAAALSSPKSERRKEIISLNDYLKERHAGGRP